MAASERELGDAYRAGYNRKPLPEATSSDSTAHSLYLQAQDDRDAGRPKDPNMWNLGRTSTPDGGDPAARTTGRPKRNGGTRSPASKASSRPTGSGRSRPASSGGKSGGLGSSARQLVTHPATLGGDGGGLMLAVFAYPIVLAILQHGPEGAVIWLKAKFLNQSPNDGPKGPTYVYPDPLKQKPA